MARRKITVGSLIFAFATIGLSSCANVASFSAGSLPVPPNSPVAIAVNDALRRPGPYPKFSDVPKTPADAPNAATAQAATLRMQNEARALEREIAGMPPIDATAAETFSAQANSAFAGEAAPDEGARERTEAMARALRARATPPPALLK
jgi:hypothetical protein